ncbi:MAG: pyridoxamine 5'-phosphate oxidase family protein [Treponema sp.]|jgi:uncharacterized pyridoxamine 5'-phosphate oxidase family protein|nr:pyridoxamine 5'-phosphate oxidase family protein [Treponema sp.]
MKRILVFIFVLFGCFFAFASGNKDTPQNDGNLTETRDIIDIKGILDFVKSNQLFFIATVEGDQPRVRPFGALMEIDGRLAFCTNDQKDVFRQMQATNKVEICSMGNMEKDMRVIRIFGEVSFDKSAETRNKFFAEFPFTAQQYKGRENIFVVCFFETASITTTLMSGDGETKETRVLY